MVGNSAKARVVAGSLATGLIASLCCGGSLVFASIGLGAFFSALGLWRYIPQALAAGALAIAAINYVFYRRAALCGDCASDSDLLKLRQGMFRGAALGVATMAMSFVFLEWLNHAVFHPQRFLIHPRYAEAVIRGVPNASLLYALASFSVLALLWAMPFPRPTLEGARADGPMPRMLRIGVMLAALALLFVLVADAIPRGGAVGPGNGQQGAGHGPHH